MSYMALVRYIVRFFRFGRKVHHDRKQRQSKPGSGRKSGNTSSGPLPRWLREAEAPGEAEMSEGMVATVLVGCQARKLKALETGLYDHFLDHVLPGHEQDRVNPEFIFAEWFNDMETGLEAVVCGNEMDEELYEAYVGLPVEAVEECEDLCVPLSSRDILEAQKVVEETFKELKLRGKVTLNLLYYFNH